MWSGSDLKPKANVAVRSDRPLPLRRPHKQKDANLFTFCSTLEMDPKHASTSSLYKALARTATSFLESCRPSPAGSNIPDKEKILSNLSRDFHMGWGHKFFVSAAPPLQGLKSGKEFVEHLEGMASRLHTWDIEITNLLVDEPKKSVMARGDFNMTPVPGSTVQNDIILIMKMDDSGEKLVEATEFVDTTAAAEIRRLMEAGQ